jgi:hypothetical protein
LEYIVSKVLEIEINGLGRNESLHFRPLGKNIRGRFDLLQETEPLARMKIMEFPQAIPGQRIGVDLETGEGYIAEPLHNAEHAATRERIESRGLRLPPAREVFAKVDVSTWLYWLKQAVESGIARVVEGVMPAKIDGDVKKSFITSRPAPARDERLAVAIERQNVLMEAMLKQMAKG